MKSIVGELLPRAPAIVAMVGIGALAIGVLRPTTSTWFVEPASAIAGIAVWPAVLALLAAASHASRALRLLALVANGALVTLALGVIGADVVSGIVAPEITRALALYAVIPGCLGTWSLLLASRRRRDAIFDRAVVW